MASVHSTWDQGKLIFYEGGIGHSTSGDILEIGGTGVVIGDSAHDVDFTVYGGAADQYFKIDWDAGTATFAKLDVGISGDLDITIEDLEIADDCSLAFGDSADVDISWSGSGNVLYILPATDDTGYISVGNGTKDIDLKVVLGAAADYVLFDVGNKLLTIAGAATLAVGADAAGTDANFYGATTAYKTWWDANGDTNGAWYFGANTKGIQVNFYGDTTGCGVFWDPTTDTNGTLSIGASGGSKGNDLIAYGATNGNYLHWDQSADDLLLVGTATQLSVAGTTASSSTTTGSLRTAGGLGVAGAAYIGGTLNLADDQAFTLGSTVATAETKITMEFDETTTGIGLFNMGSVSAPMVLNTNPGATVIGHTVNILHSAGAGDCADLIACYQKTAVSGTGDSDTTLVGTASRAYVGTAGGDTTVAKECYGAQPWASHFGTGAITAMSGLSAKVDVNTGNFTATTVNAGHFHVEGAATVTSSYFDGVMIEIYPDVTCLDAGLRIAVDSTAVVTDGIAIGGATSNGVNISGATQIGVNVSLAALTVGDAYSGVRSSVTCAAPSNAYGAAGYFESTYNGTGAGHFYNFGSWVNFGTSAVSGAYIVAAQDNGLYGTVTATNSSLIFGMRMEAIITGTPTILAPFSLNTDNKAITALFGIASAPAIGYVMGTPSTATVPCGTIPIFCDADGTDVRYVHIYDTTA